MPVESVYHPEPEDQFPARPAVAGRIKAIPKETFAALGTVAGCASKDETRYVLNGVLFSPADGGRLIATDGKRLACAPARVTGQEFILRTAATHVLAHPDFLSRDAAVMQPDNPDGAHVQFRSGPHTLIAKMIEGSFPDYRCAIPGNPTETVTVPDTHKHSAIAWLRSLRGRTMSVKHPRAPP
jgi:DNA polymerase III sliding clamp (beta) subunit (PCNA family)